MKKNCWEVKLCGRCATILVDDACPVCKATKLNGVNGGFNGGRACWTIPKTKCDGITQGSFSSKLRNCVVCDFYKMVKEEEKESFELFSENAV